MVCQELSHKSEAGPPKELAQIARQEPERNLNVLKKIDRDSSSGEVLILLQIDGFGKSQYVLIGVRLSTAPLHASPSRLVD